MHAADVADAEGGKQVLRAMKAKFTRLRQWWADGGYGTPGGALVTWVREQLDWTVEIVQKLVGQTRFVVLPKRWIVERTFAWLCRNRRLSKDYEHHTFCSEAHVYIASIGLLLKALTKAS